jgi:hypothetical protein
MAETKPKRASEYDSEQVALVRKTCLYVATKLGDLMDDIVVVGGLVPTLLIDQEEPTEGREAHVGTLDLDIGLELALLDEGRYREVAERLRRAGFVLDENPQGNPTRHRWRHDESGVTVDFLIPPSEDGDRGGTIRHLEADFAAVIIPGLSLAFRDGVRVSLDGETIRGEKARRKVRVCGAGAFVVLKSLAFRQRGEEKDAYDLYYVVKYFGSDVSDVAARVRALMPDPQVEEALSFLAEDFAGHDSVGPIRAAEFIHGVPDEETQADVVGFVARLLGLCRE